MAYMRDDGHLVPDDSDCDPFDPGLDDEHVDPSDYLGLETPRRPDATPGDPNDRDG